MKNELKANEEYTGTLIIYPAQPVIQNHTIHKKDLSPGFLAGWLRYLRSIGTKMQRVSNQYGRYIHIYEGKNLITLVTK